MLFENLGWPLSILVDRVQQKGSHETPEARSSKMRQLPGVSLGTNAQKFGLLEASVEENPGGPADPASSPDAKHVGEGSSGDPTQWLKVQEGP